MNDKFDPDWEEFQQHQMAQIRAIAALMDDLVPPPPPKPEPEHDVRLLEQLRYLAIDLDLSGNPDAEIVWIAYEKLGGVR